MERMKYIYFLIIYILVSAGNADAKALIYDEEKGAIYIGNEVRIIKNYEETKKSGNVSANKIHEIQVKANNSSTLFETTKPISEYKLSVKGYIAIVVSNWIELRGGLWHNKSSLMVYNQEGTKIKEIPDVQVSSRYYDCFSWSPDGGKIAYVTGGPTRDEKYGPFSPTGVWIYDIAKDTTEKVGGGFGVNWSEHDGNLYMQSSYKDTLYGVVYDVKQGKTSNSGKNGLIFSEDGMYSVGRKPSEEMEWGTSYDVYNNQKNESVYKFKRGPRGGQEEWIGYAKFILGSHYLLMWSSSSNYRIFDVDKRIFIRQATPTLLGWNKDMTKAVVYEKGKIHIDEMLTGKRLMSLDLPGE
ncbi:MAG: hypothetical protein OEV42_21040 [Deltaproteobacteria bacterium]|nr:hypothetical protein [Deltaproteobacteria bacterium]